MKHALLSAGVIVLLVGFLGCSAPLSKREQGAAVGTLGGAGVGAIIGNARSASAQHSRFGYHWERPISRPATSSTISRRNGTPPLPDQ